LDGIPHESGKVIDKTFFDNFVEFIKFMLVGGTSFAIDLVVALIFQYFAQDYLGTLNIFGNSFIIKDIYVAVILGFVVSVPFNFFLNRYFTFIFFFFR
jgi:putative flippase GtrA